MVKFSDQGDWRHLCVDMQRVFAEDTPWHVEWMDRISEEVEAVVRADAARCIFTCFIPPKTVEEAPGAWRAYYEKWPMMTQQALPPELIEVIPSPIALYPTRPYLPQKRLFALATWGSRRNPAEGACIDDCDNRRRNGCLRSRHRSRRDRPRFPCHYGRGRALQRKGCDTRRSVKAALRPLFDAAAGLRYGDTPRCSSVAIRSAVRKIFVSQRHHSSSQQRKKGNKPGRAQLGHQSSQQRRSSRDPESRSRNQQQPEYRGCDPEGHQDHCGRAYRA